MLQLPNVGECPKPFYLFRDVFSYTAIQVSPVELADPRFLGEAELRYNSTCRSDFLGISKIRQGRGRGLRVRAADSVGATVNYTCALTHLPVFAVACRAAVFAA